MALISHLPQVMSSLLASRLQDTPLHPLSLAGNGLRDVTRIAASDPGLWVQILSANAAPVVDILHGVREDLDRLIGTLEAPRRPGARLDIAQLMSEGNAGQARIPGKHGGPPQAFASLTVLVDDNPGRSPGCSPRSARSASTSRTCAWSTPRASTWAWWRSPCCPTGKNSSRRSTSADGRSCSEHRNYPPAP